jgi:hypothetical protein
MPVLVAYCCFSAEAVAVDVLRHTYHLPNGCGIYLVTLFTKVYAQKMKILRAKYRLNKAIYIGGLLWSTKRFWKGQRLP